MSVDSYADIVRNDIAKNYGNTSDLGEELVNTLTNIHYFFVKSKHLNLGGLTDIKDIYPVRSESELVLIYMEHMKHIIFSMALMPDLIKGLREIRKQDLGMAVIFEEAAVDMFKYKIKDALNKTGIERSAERGKTIPTEHSGLARRFRIPFNHR